MTASLPAVAGRFTMAGVEPLLLAFLVWVIVLVLELVDRPEGIRAPILLGVVVGLGMLCKWTLAIPLLGLVILLPNLVQTGRLRRLLRGLGLTGGIAAALFALWWLPHSQWSAFVGAAGAEASTVEELGMSPILYLPHWFLFEGLGGAALLLLPMASFGLHRGRANREAAKQTLLALGGIFIAVFVVHQVIPHKEARYLLPAALVAGVLIGSGLGAWLVRALPVRRLVFAC